MIKPNTYFIAIKNPKMFEPDHVFEIPEAIVGSGYVNVDFNHAKQWYKQIYPQKETNNDKTNNNL